MNEAPPTQILRFYLECREKKFLARLEVASNQNLDVSHFSSRRESRPTHGNNSVNRDERDGNKRANECIALNSITQNRASFRLGLENRDSSPGFQCHPKITQMD
jgi:hypothetical protein